MFLLTGCSSKLSEKTDETTSWAIDVSRLHPVLIDLGEVPPTRNTTEVQVKLKNPTSSPITILAAKGDCGCMTVGLEPDTKIPAKGEFVFSISIQPPKKLDIYRQTFIWTSLNKEQPIAINISGSMDRGIIWRPQHLYVYLDGIRLDEPHSVSFFTKDSEFKLVSANTDMKDVKVEINANGNRLDLRVLSNDKIRRRSGSIIVKTNSDFASELIIPVTILGAG